MRFAVRSVVMLALVMGRGALGQEPEPTPAPAPAPESTPAPEPAPAPAPASDATPPAPPPQAPPPLLIAPRETDLVPGQLAAVRPAPV
jgi:hypothetical protein